MSVELSSIFKPVSIGNVKRIAIIGDSISSPSANGGWAELGALATKGKLLIVKNNAVAGYSLAQINSSFSLTIEDGLDEVWLQAGTNYPGVTGENKLSLDSIVSKVQAIHAEPVLHCIPPSNVSTEANNAGNAWNFYLYKYCIKNNIKLRNYWGHVIDPATGGIIPSLTTDGTHPSSSTHLAIAANIASIYGSEKTLQPFANSGAGLSTNVLNLVDSNSDGLADGLILGSGKGTTNKSLVSNYSDFIGKAQMIAFTSSGSGGYIDLAREVSGIVPGNEYIGSFRLDIPQTANARLQIKYYWFNGATQLSLTFVTRYSPIQNNGRITFSLGVAPENATKARIGFGIITNEATSEFYSYFGEADIFLANPV